MIDKNEILAEIKRDFFIFRNGIIADGVKKLYPEGVTIYGLNVAQFLEMAKKYPRDLELGKILWEDIKSRESRLFSLYVFPYEQIEKEYALKMVREVRNREEAEFLAFRILRNLPFAQNLLEELKAEEDVSPASLYCREMLEKNLLRETL